MTKAAITDVPHMADSAAIPAPMRRGAAARRTLQRRQHVRVPASIRAVVVNRRGDAVDASTVDIGGGGASIEVKRPTDALVEGERVELLIKVPGRPIVAKARVVVQREPTIYGLEFVDLAERDREQLVALVFHRLQWHGTRGPETEARSEETSTSAETGAGGLRGLARRLLGG